MSKATASAAILEAENAEKAMQAYLLRQQGKSWYDIAEELDMTEHAAKDAMVRGMAAAAEAVAGATRRMLLTLELDRLDALQAAHWQQATQPVQRIGRNGLPVTEPPDVRAGEFILKVMAMRAKLLGLEVEEAVSDVRTVVVPATSEDYVAALRLVSGRREIEA